MLGPNEKTSMKNLPKRLNFTAWAVFVLVALMLFAGCKDKTVIVPDNEPPSYSGISRIQIENYINRIYIDLIGREPLNVELEADLLDLQNNQLDFATRETIISRLQSDQTWRDGDSSYFYAYNVRLYDLVKLRMLEGVGDAHLKLKIGNLNAAIQKDSLLGDSVGVELAKAKRLRYTNVLYIANHYMDGSINIKEYFGRTLHCPVYDEINMNTFNFINAAFNDLYFRYPTTEEYDAAFNMIEYNISDLLFQTGGQTKPDFINIISNNNEMLEGIIRWAYWSLLAREPSSAETSYLMSDFINDLDMQKVQRQIMISDEYAGF